MSKDSMKSSILILLTAVSLLMGNDTTSHDKPHSPRRKKSSVYTLPFVSAGGSRLSGPILRGGANFYIGDSFSLIPFISVGLHDIGIGGGFMLGGSKGTYFPGALMASGTLFTNYLETRYTQKINYEVPQQGVHITGSLMLLIFYLDVGMTYTFDDNQEFFNWGLGVTLY